MSSDNSFVRGSDRREDLSSLKRVIRAELDISQNETIIF